MDFAARVKAQLRLLRPRLDRRDTILDVVRSAHATLDARKIGIWLVREAESWIPAPCWAILAPDLSGRLSLVAERGLTPDVEPSVWRVANWVMVQGVEFMSGDLSKDRRARPDGHGSALALPLVCRGRTVGVLVAIDPAPSASTPSLGRSVLGKMRALLELVALALDSALSFRKEEALSVTDDLTSLANSRYLNVVLRREEKRAGRSGRPLSVLFIDMDGFKGVNDNHGHLAGSKALVEAAGVIRACARETDIVARFGGDEFALVLPDTDQKGARAVAERILERVRAFVFLEGDGLSLGLTVSIGAATLPDVTQSAEELLKAADSAMYRVKDLGGDGIHFAGGDT